MAGYWHQVNRTTQTRRSNSALAAESIQLSLNKADRSEGLTPLSGKSLQATGKWAFMIWRRMVGLAPVTARWGRDRNQGYIHVPNAVTWDMSIMAASIKLLGNNNSPDHVATDNGSFTLSMGTLDNGPGVSPGAITSKAFN